MKRGTYDLMNEIASTITADGDIAAYCLAQFSKPLKIRVGIDDDAQPDSSVIPVLAMRPGSYAPASDRSHRMVTVLFSLVIESSGSSTSGNITKMTGLQALEDLYFRVENALENHALEKYNLQVSPDQIQTDIAFPLFRATWALTYQEDYQ